MSIYVEKMVKMLVVAVCICLLSSATALQVTVSSTIQKKHYLSSSKLFGVSNMRYNHIKNSKLYSSTNNSGGSTSSSDTTSSTEITKQTTNSSTSFLSSIDNLGMKLKPWAVLAHEKSLTYSANNNNNDDNVNGIEKKSPFLIRYDKFKSITYSLKSSLLWMTYIVYRGYRGFFVILPAVFKEVYRQLDESSLVIDVYGDDNDNDEVQEKSAQQEQEPIRWRTRITISVLSAMLTLSYVVSGALRVLGSFIKSFTNTLSVESSLEAAADEVAINEDKLRNKLGDDDENKDT